MKRALTLLALPLLLAACGGGSGTTTTVTPDPVVTLPSLPTVTPSAPTTTPSVPTVTPSVPVITPSTPVSMPAAAPVSAVVSVQGTVSLWNGGAGTVRLLAADGSTLSSASVNSGGVFTLPLPQAGALTPGPLSSSLFGANCVSSMTSSTDGVQGYTFQTLSATRADGSVSNVSATVAAQSQSGTTVTASGTIRLWLYASAGTTLAGSVQCQATQDGVNVTSTYKVNATLLQGWNLLTAPFTLTSDLMTNQGALSATVTSRADGASIWYPAVTLPGN